MPVAKKILKQYIASLSDKEKQTYTIAKDHLGSSFSLEKSIGFQQWLIEKKKLMNIYQ